MKHIDILNDRITVNQINGKTEAVAALREVREVIQALPATGEAAARKRVEELEAERSKLQDTLDGYWRTNPDLITAAESVMSDLEKLRAERDAALAEVARLKATTVPEMDSGWIPLCVREPSTAQKVALRSPTGRVAVHDWLFSMSAMEFFRNNFTHWKPASEHKTKEDAQ